MNVFTKIALASTGMVEIKRNQAGFILYIQGRANPPRLERFVTLGSFPRWSNILQPLTGGRRNRLTICQIRYKKQIVRRWHCLLAPPLQVCSKEMWRPVCPRPWPPLLLQPRPPAGALHNMFNRLWHATNSIFSTKHFYIVLGQISVGRQPPAGWTGSPTSQTGSCVCRW